MEVTIVILASTAKEAIGFTNRYAIAAYLGAAGHAPRNGLVRRQYYAGQILEGGRFRVLKPDRLCCLSEFRSFQLVSKRWRELTDLERTLLIEVYDQKKLALDSCSTEMASTARREAAQQLVKAGYLRWAEPKFIETTLLGEAEIQHRLFNLGAGDSLVDAIGGIRIQHHTVQDHEVDLGQASTLFVNLDGLRVRIYTLKGSGAVIRIDHEDSHQIYMGHIDKDKHYAQTYVDRAACAVKP
jgi:hypothetical protein